MNTQRSLDDFDASYVYNVDFNSSSSYFIAALDTGFAIFNSNCELYMNEELGKRLVFATMLENSQIIGLTSDSGGSKIELNKLTIFDSSTKKEVAAIKVDSPVIRSKLTNSHIAIVRESGLTLYKHQPRIHKIATYDTATNGKGLCCLGSRTAVFPGRTPGQIQIVDLASLKIKIVPAHTSALRALALSPDEEVVASASEQGTLIRVHTTGSCTRIGELRRGVSSANIYSLAISPSSNRVAVTSDTNTLHVFDLPHPRNQFDSKNSPTPSSSTTPPSSSANSMSPFNIQKWGGLAKLPFAPRVLSDIYSIASATFDPGKDEDIVSPENRHLQGHEKRETTKGIAGWSDDNTLLIINAGKDARYERFSLHQDDNGKPLIVRAGWSRFMRPN